MENRYSNIPTILKTGKGKVYESVLLPNVDATDSDTALGLGFMFLMFWLAIMNVVLYVIYRVTGTKKRECPACGKNVAKGLTVCPSCNFDFMKAAKGPTEE